MPTHILVVEDNQELNMLLRHVLVAQGFTVDTATSLSEAIALCQTRLPNVAVVDYQLPEGNGIAVLEHIQSMAPQRIPAALITANPYLPSKLYDGKVDAMFVKPVYINQLVEFIQAHHSPKTLHA